MFDWMGGLMISKIAFLGLGQMGTPMAARLLQAGHRVTVWDRTPERATLLVERGAVATASPAEAAAGVDVAITMLATPDALEEVVFGDEGLAFGLGLGQIFIDMSTVGPRTVGEVRARVPYGVSMVDAPVRGSVPQATAGSLAIFVGATVDDFERVRPILESLGGVRHVGGPGSGAAMKLVVNATLGASIVAFGEALALAKSLRLDRGPVLDVLAESSIGPAVAAKRAMVEANCYPPSFKLRHAAKDMRLVVEAGEARGLDLREASAARAWLDESAEQGAADLDYAAVVATILGEGPSVHSESRVARQGD
jgi:3-hydroxyisobutyrate dehydrogenase-like beta-hydroxyacid dehydrogenase